jgi:hypothetical protein
LKISGDSLGIFGERFPLDHKVGFVLKLCLRFTGDFLVEDEEFVALKYHKVLHDRILQVRLLDK